MMLHNYGQGFEHETVLIVGDKEELENLKRAIEKAIDSGKGCIYTRNNDGEGYEIRIIRIEQNESDNIILPYWCEESMDSRKCEEYPFVKKREV